MDYTTQGASNLGGFWATARGFLEFFDVVREIRAVLTSQAVIQAVMVLILLGYRGHVF